MEFGRILTKARSGEQLSLDEIKHLLLVNNSEQSQLFNAASAIRNQHVGKKVFVRAVVEFSNFCYCNCLYCGMRRDNDSLTRYRLSIDEIKKQARYALELGVHTLFLQSGEDNKYPVDALCDVIRWATSENDQIVLLCIGKRTMKDYEKLFAAGASKFILKFETSNPHLFARMKQKETLQTRLKHLVWLKEAGFKISTGFIVGLPGQTVEDIARDILLLKEMEVSMASASPFIPNDRSPLAGERPGSLDLTLNAVAIMRMMLPAALIPSVSAFERLRPGGQALGFEAGCNVMTINMTPSEYQDRYLIYASSRHVVRWEFAKSTIEKAGLQIVDYRE